MSDTLYSLEDFGYALKMCEAEGFTWMELDADEKQSRLDKAASYNDPTLDPRDTHLSKCDRCEEHVGIGIYDDNWGFTPEKDRKPVEHVCLWCVGKVNPAYQGQPLFKEVVRQRAADIKAGLAPREYP